MAPFTCLFHQGPRWVSTICEGHYACTIQSSCSSRSARHHHRTRALHNLQSSTATGRLCYTFKGWLDACSSRLARNCIASSSHAGPEQPQDLAYPADPKTSRILHWLPAPLPRSLWPVPKPPSASCITKGILLLPDHIVARPTWHT